jgi:S-adenosylmethionine synthetase
MYEKVNPSHPDKVADRIAGALVDLAYAKEVNPRIAVEVLIGHGTCTIITETSVALDPEEVFFAVNRIAGDLEISYYEAAQDTHLSENQSGGIRCGDNGIFCGMPVTDEQKDLSKFARSLYAQIPKDGKFILSGNRLIVCQSNASYMELRKHMEILADDIADIFTVNPLGDWTGGPDVDSGATNRKLGSDMGDAVTGGGLHGKDLSKADVSVNIYAHLKAQRTGKPVRLFCAIGDDTVDGRPYAEIVAIARQYINDVGGFEKFAEWGLI